MAKKKIVVICECCALVIVIAMLAFIGAGMPNRVTIVNGFFVASANPAYSALVEKRGLPTFQTDEIYKAIKGTLAGKKFPGTRLLLFETPHKQSFMMLLDDVWFWVARGPSFVVGAAFIFWVLYKALNVFAPVVLGTSTCPFDLPSDTAAYSVMMVLYFLMPTAVEEYATYLIERRAEWACRYSWTRVRILTYSALAGWLITESIHLVTAPFRALIRLMG